MSLANEPIIPFKRKAEPLPELPGNLFVRLVTAKAYLAFIMYDCRM